MEALEQAGLVLRNHLAFVHTEDDGLLIEVGLSGIIECAQAVFIKVDKSLEVRKVQSGQLQVKGKDYAYHAYLREPQRDLMRYCSAHGLDDLHCHNFDLATGDETDQPRIRIAELPTLGEFIPRAVDLGRQARELAG